MKIILLKDVRKVGRKYEIKDVADGYAMNALIPFGKALPATPGNIKSITAKKESDLLLRKDLEETLNYAISKLKDGKLSIEGKVNDKGHLFAGIHEVQIAEEIKKQVGIEIPAEALSFEKPIKEIGIHKLKISIGDKQFELTVEIKAQK